MTMIWNREIETLPRDRMDALQLERLRATIGRVLASVAPLAGRLGEAGIRSPADIGSLTDLSRLPFTRKADLREHYPFGLLAVPVSELARIQGSSGTRGKPTIVGYTRNDLAIWAEVVARCLVLGGVRPGMVVHNAYGYGLFTGGLGLHGGADLLGCTIVPISGGMTQRQAMLLRDLGAQVLCSTPSYALSIAEALDAGQIPRSSLKLEIGIFGAEPWTEQLRDELQRRLAIAALNIYGLSEIIGPGVSAECIEARNGSHVQEDHFLAEVIDPETGAQLPPGAEGELVFTTLTKEALPLIRYRTGDISSLDPAPCLCGRTTVRMSRIKGRYDDMLIIRGVNLYPSEVERILLDVGDLGPHYQLIVERPGTLDELSLLCEPARDGLDRDQLQARLHHALREQIGLSIMVQVLEREGVPRSEGKAVRVVDRRPR
ncbi:MAG TPA: phenylacetate--CoA ligase [Gemmatimonadales bacterium]|jgi:phenylacetate-CoA ligase|nr:phenylacetate--CoA ligase [Gemmatimonadales bacterium]